MKIQVTILEKYPSISRPDQFKQMLSMSQLYNHTMGYYSAIKRNQILVYATP